jgi:hypothetical protein
MRRQRENRITQLKETFELRPWIASGPERPGVRALPSLRPRTTVRAESECAPLPGKSPTTSVRGSGEKPRHGKTVICGNRLARVLPKTKCTVTAQGVLDSRSANLIPHAQGAPFPGGHAPYRRRQLRDWIIRFALHDK